MKIESNILLCGINAVLVKFSTVGIFSGILSRTAFPVGFPGPVCLFSAVIRLGIVGIRLLAGIRLLPVIKISGSRIVCRSLDLLQFLLLFILLTVPCAGFAAPSCQPEAYTGRGSKTTFSNCCIGFSYLLTISFSKELARKKRGAHTAMCPFAGHVINMQR